MNKEAMTLALELEALTVKFSKGWHEGIKIDASDIMLLNDAAQALAAQPAQRTWVGLTDEEMRLIDPDGFEDNLPQMIQQALKEKNT